MPVHIGPEKRKHDRSIPAFCKRKGICTSTFYNHRDRMPVVTKVGSRSLILETSEQEWERKQSSQQQAAA